jgi:hypothetical protein
MALEHGYQDLADTAVRIRTQPSALDAYQEATNPPPFHQQDPAHLAQMIEEMMTTAGLSDAEQERARPVLQRMMRYEVYLDSQREAVCQHLALLQDKRGRKIGPFEAMPPNWRVTCRLRGIAGITPHPNAGALLRQFTAAICSTCELRAPATMRREFAHDDLDIYAPFLQRLADEGHATEL